MKNSEYWAQRMTLLDEALLDKGEAYLKNVEKQYKRAETDIDKEISVWYRRLMKNNDVSMAEARKMLTSSELAEFQWTVEEYIDYGKKNALNGQWMKQLENASARVHISRLESLKIHLDHQVEKVLGAQESAMTTLLSDIYREGYNRTAFELQKGAGVFFSFQQPDTRRIEKVLSRPWHSDGKDFSDRVWKNKTDLLNSMNTHLSQMIIRGESPDKAIAALAKDMETSKHNAGTLIMTESAAFASAAQRDCFNDLDVGQYEVVETLDAKTCEICGAMDGKVLDMKDYQVGVTAPPFHPNCRGCTAPYFADMDDWGAKRAARDINGKPIEVPADMTYEQWKQMQGSQFGTGSVDKARQMAYNESTDEKQWKKYRDRLGDDVSDNFEEFQKLKYGNEEYYSYMKLDYQRQNRLVNHPEFALPNAERATADDRKFLGYLFNPENANGIAKGKAFASRLGYDQNNFLELKREILERAKKYPAIFKGNNTYGDRYEQKIILYGTKNTPANVVVGWIKEQNAIKMTSAYIKEVD